MYIQDSKLFSLPPKYLERKIYFAIVPHNILPIIFIKNKILTPKFQKIRTDLDKKKVIKFLKKKLLN